MQLQGTSRANLFIYFTWKISLFFFLFIRTININSFILFKHFYNILSNGMILFAHTVG